MNYFVTSNAQDLHNLQCLIEEHKTPSTLHKRSFWSANHVTWRSLNVRWKEVSRDQYVEHIESIANFGSRDQHVRGIEKVRLNRQICLPLKCRECFVFLNSMKNLKQLDVYAKVNVLEHRVCLMNKRSVFVRSTNSRKKLNQVRLDNLNDPSLLYKIFKLLISFFIHVEFYSQFYLKTGILGNVCCEWK